MPWADRFTCASAVVSRSAPCIRVHMSRINQELQAHTVSSNVYRINAVQAFVYQHAEQGWQDSLWSAGSAASWWLPAAAAPAPAGAQSGPGSLPGAEASPAQSPGSTILEMHTHVEQEQCIALWTMRQQ